MSHIYLVRDSPQAPDRVWRALTEPSPVTRWMIAAIPKGFASAQGSA